MKSELNILSLNADLPHAGGGYQFCKYQEYTL